MQQIFSVLANLDSRRRLIVIGATVLMFAAIIGLSKLAATPSMSLLYSSLDASASGEVIQALEARGEVYEIRGGSIFVATKKRDELRMTLASDGLPANSATGYELLDSLSGFGTTSQMFDAAYWRAKEGELARTIVSSQQIQSARVHIANPSSQPFKRQIAATASVTVTASGGSVPASQARALRFLIASAVSGLAPEDVAVIDGRNGVVLSGDEANSQNMQRSDKAADLRKNVERILEARVGHGHVVVEVSVEAEMDQETIVEKTFDPESRVAISSETEEKSNSSTDSRGSAVTVASNLPSGNAATSGDANANNSETRERVNYEVSETRRELQRGPGAIKRLTVAVLIDGLRSVDPNTQAEIWEPRTAEELQSLHELVASTVGFDASRGDQITIKTLQFEPIRADGTSAESASVPWAQLDVMTIIQVAILGLVSLILGLFVIRPILAKPISIGSEAALALPPRNTESSLRSDPLVEFPSMSSQAGNVLTGEIDDEDFELPTLGVVSDFDFDDEDIGISADPVKRLKKLIEDRQEETVEILRGWMDDAKEAG